MKTETEPTLISFTDIPLGSRFRYPGKDPIYTVLTKYRNLGSDSMHGTIAPWPNTARNQIFSHLPDDPDAGCPEMVEFVD